MINPYASPQYADVAAPVAAKLSLQPASRLRRLFASLLDGILMLIVVLPVWYGIAYLVEPGDPLGFMDTGRFLLIGIPISIGIFLAMNGYFLATNGQTIGKKALGIKIVRTNGDAVSLARIIGLRMLPIGIVGQIPGIGSLIELIDVLLIFRRNRKCLHDDLADTIVILA